MTLTPAQQKHLSALTTDWVSMKEMRKVHGFCNLNTLYKLLEAGLTEHRSGGGKLEDMLIRKVK